jgi:hypothetical protein
VRVGVGDGFADFFGEADADGGASRYEDDAVFVPDVALSVSMNRPNTRPARSVSSGPGRFITVLPRGELPAHESGLGAVGKEAYRDDLTPSSGTE